MPRPILSTRALNRATLARQLLLERAPMPPLEAVRHLVGLQAQVPLGRGAAVLEVTLADRLAQRAVASVEAEGRRYLRFAASDADTIDVRVRRPA